MTDQEIVIGTRGSKLALEQANMICNELRSLYKNIKFSLQIINTSGDRILDKQLDKIGGKGLFIKELELSLLSKEIHLAVHSAKDLPHTIDEDFKIAAITRREDPRDVLISVYDCEFEELPIGARIGSGSLRRGYQAKRLRPDVEVIPIRGNIDTRISKVSQGSLDGIIIAAAGINRLKPEICHDVVPLSTDIFIPAAGQGGLILETRKDDNRTNGLLEKLNDPISSREIFAERAFLKQVDGGCSVPVGVFAKITNDKIDIKGFLADQQNELYCYSSFTTMAEEYIEAGMSLGREIKNKMGY